MIKAKMNHFSLDNTITAFMSSSENLLLLRA